MGEWYVDGCRARNAVVMFFSTNASPLIPEPVDIDVEVARSCDQRPRLTDVGQDEFPTCQRFWVVLWSAHESKPSDFSIE